MVRRVGLGDLTPQLGDIIAKTIVSVCPDVCPYHSFCQLLL